MTPEELDEARAKEAWRIWNESEEDDTLTTSIIAARLAREGWTPPESVDPDVLAFREWATTLWPNVAEGVLHGNMDYTEAAKGFLAGARMAREQERERAKGLVDNLANLVWRVGADWAQDDVTGINASEMISAREALAKYRGEA